MKVYVVTAGEYSDYHICKIFLDKEKAEKYVAIENEINQYYDECWINEWETDDDNVDMTAKVGHYYYAYIDMGGHQLQLNAVNTELMKDAQEHPEKHRQLVVRIWGWSAYFVELDKEYQDHVMRRQQYQV